MGTLFQGSTPSLRRCQFFPRMTKWRDSAVCLWYLSACSQHQTPSQPCCQWPVRALWAVTFSNRLWQQQSSRGLRRSQIFLQDWWMVILLLSLQFISGNSLKHLQLYEPQRGRTELAPMPFKWEHEEDALIFKAQKGFLWDVFWKLKHHIIASALRANFKQETVSVIRHLRNSRCLCRSCCIIWLEEKLGGEEVILAFLEPAESTYAISLKCFLPDSGVAIRAGWSSGLFPGCGSAQKGFTSWSLVEMRIAHRVQEVCF